MRSIYILPVVILLTPFFFLQRNVYGVDIAEGVAIQQNIPEWVKVSPAPSSKNIDALKGKRNHYYLFDRQVLVTDTVAQFIQVTVQALDPDAVAEYSQLNFQFDPSYEKLQFHQIQVWRDGKKIDKLGDADIRVLSQEKELDNLIYNGKKTASVILKDIRKNDIIDYAYTTTGYNPVFGKKYHNSFPFGWSPTIDKARVRINMVGNHPLYHKMILGTAQPTIQKNGDTTTYEWIIEKTPSIRYEPKIPKWAIQYPELQVSEYKNWQEVAQWAENLFSSPIADESIDQWLTQILQPDSPNKLLKVLDFVQNEIRYLGIEIGENSHKPSSPGDVLRNRYGDCKDKSLLLATLLKRLGNKATPALVSSRYGKAIKNWIPSPTAFDHVIVKISTPKGEYWVDPTRTMQSGTLDHRYIGNLGQALLIAPNQTHLVDVPRNKHLNKISISEQFTISALDKPSTLEVTSSYFGPIGNIKKVNLKGQYLEEAKDDFFSYYNEIYKNIKPKYEIHVTSEEHSPATQISESYTLETPWKELTNHLSLKTYADVIYAYTDTKPKPTRTMPISIAHPIDIAHQVKISLPQGSILELDDAQVQVENDFYDYQRIVKHEGNNVIISHSYQSKTDHIRPDQIKLYLTDLETTQNALTYWVTWQKPTYTTIKSRLDRLKELARSHEK